ncbi:MAG: biotin--[acetyl-CoA-carboxylase] ligase [Candidatus Krumholzibacteriota bacterium]|nr:biotin--[acetyl-CoA-carboxylase] ligase [Candidatus Krumholzibacteriota bacterium]
MVREGGDFTRRLPPDLHPVRLRDGLGENRLGAVMIVRERVDSTNTAAAALASAGAVEGTVLVAGEQLQGRGRKGRKWFSTGAGSLVFSIILRPRSGRESLTALLALSACEALDEIIPGIMIKWPNDLYLRDKKFAGILAESGEDYVVLGMGIDVNEKGEDFPEDLREVAISLRMAAHKVFDRGEILSRILGKLNLLYERWEGEGFAAFKWDLQSRLLYRGEDVCLDRGERFFQGRLVGVTVEGYAILEIEGEEKIFSAGDLTLRKG